MPALARLELLERGEISARRVRAIVANLAPGIGGREVATATRLLNWSEQSGEVEMIQDDRGPGNIVFVEIESPAITEVFTGFGEVGTAAEAVADIAAKQARRYLAAGVPVGVYLADQLLPVLAAGAGGSFRTLALSQHSLTNADVVKQFLDVTITAAVEGRDVVRVDVDRK